MWEISGNSTHFTLYHHHILLISTVHEHFVFKKQEGLIDKVQRIQSVLFDYGHNSSSFGFLLRNHIKINDNDTIHGCRALYEH